MPARGARSSHAASVATAGHFFPRRFTRFAVSASSCGRLLSSLAATLNGVLQSEALGALLIDKSARIWRNCFAASCGSGGSRLILEKADLSPPWPRKPLRTSTTKDKMNAFSPGYVSQLKPLPKQAARPIGALNPPIPRDVHASIAAPVECRSERITRSNSKV